MKIRTLVPTVLFHAGLLTGMAEAKQPLTVVDAIATTRAMGAASVDGERKQFVFNSPDGRRYAMMLVRGSIERDGVEVELISGSLDSLRSAEPYVAARLFTRGWGRRPTGENDSAILTWEMVNPPRWIDNDRVAFFWEDARETKQVVAVNVLTRQIEYLTSSNTDVMSFNVNPQGMLVYGARRNVSRERSGKLLRSGYHVTTPDALALLNGIVDGTGIEDLLWGNWERFVSTPAHPEPRKVRIAGGNGAEQFASYVAPQFSPNGQFAIMDGTPIKVPRIWNQYTSPQFSVRIGEYRDNPGVGYARQIKQFFVLDVERATARPLWNAPMNTVGRPKIAWSPTGRSILVGPTFVPVRAADEAGLGGRALVEVEVATGLFRPLPLKLEASARIAEMRWLLDERVIVRLKDGQYLQFRKEGNSWRELVTGEARERVSWTADNDTPVRVELRHDINTPPALYAVEMETGRDIMLAELNPDLRSDFYLGKVEMVNWRDRDGRDWSGKLYLPVNYTPARQYPLVIQTNTSGYIETEFSLYGGGGTTAGPGYSVHLAQPLANRGVAVLQACVPKDSLAIEGVRLNRILPYINCYEAAAEYLVKRGLVDRRKVGLMGHSNRGWHVEYAIAFSEFPYAAAIADDNIDAGYMQPALFGWSFGLGEDLTGGSPFGEGFKAWLENSPSFNARRIRTPLLLQVTDGGIAAPIMTGWEMFSRLRYLKKPVDFYVAPNITRGSHGLQNPAQVRAVQERALDWWLFWLKEEEDSNPAKSEQYAHWRYLRGLRDAVLKETRPSLLKWTATPVISSLGRETREAVPETLN